MWNQMKIWKKSDFNNQVDILKHNIKNPPDELFHCWNDGWEYWNDLYSAINEIDRYFRKARVLAYTKEKYGTYRVSVLGVYDGTLKSILKPNVRYDFDWHYYGSFMRGFVESVIEPCVNWILKGVSKVDRFVAKLIPKFFKNFVINRQKSKVNEGFQKVCLKYPHIVHELVSDIDCYEWIKPYDDYVLDGEEIFNRHWKRVK